MGLHHIWKHPTHTPRSTPVSDPDAAELKPDSVFAACSHSEAAILSAVHLVILQLLKGFDVYHKDWDGYTCCVPMSVSVEESPQSHQGPTRWTIFIYHITGIAKHQEKISRETEAHRGTPVPQMQDTNQADNCANMHTGTYIDMQ